MAKPLLTDGLWEVIELLLPPEPPKIDYIVPDNYADSSLNQAIQGSSSASFEQSEACSVGINRQSVSKGASLLNKQFDYNAIVGGDLESALGKA